MPATDALCAAAELVLAVEDAGRREASTDSVATTTRVTCRPGAINVVPGEAEVLVDVVASAPRAGRNYSCVALRALAAPRTDARVAVPVGF